MNQTSLQRYQKRLDDVLSCINQCLSVKGRVDLSRLDANRLADVACTSPYHWHRIYSAMMGETLSSTIKRVRLHKACSRLIYTQDSIANIASDLGYASVPSFSRAFRQHYHMPPAQYRREGRHHDFELTWSNTMNQFTHDSDQQHEVSIQHLEPATAMGILHVGSYMDIGQAFHQLFGVLSANEWDIDTVDTLGIYFDDPTCVPSEQLRSMACAILPSENITQDGAHAICQRYDSLQLQAVRGGEYAVLSFTGPYAALGYAYGWLYGYWLPNSGREPEDAPVFERYLNNPRQVAPNELRTDIYLPLKAVAA